MKNYSRTKGKSHRIGYRTPSRVRVQKTLISKLHGVHPPQQAQMPQQPKPPYGS